MQALRVCCAGASGLVGEKKGNISKTDAGVDVHGKSLYLNIKSAPADYGLSGDTLVSSSRVGQGKYIKPWPEAGTAALIF